MKSKALSKNYVIMYSLYFALFGGLLIYATFYDLSVSQRLFDPHNMFGVLFEYFGEFPRYALCGFACTVLLFTRHDLNGCLEIIGKIFPFIKPFSEKHTASKLYVALDFILSIVEVAGFTVGAFVGWKKETDNIVKYLVVLMTGERSDSVLSNGKYLAISVTAAVALVFIGYFVASKLEPKTLKRLETLAVFGMFVYFLYPLINTIKGYISRVRFREMVGYSNGFIDPDGYSYGRDPAIVRSMAENADFSAFTRWYQRSSSHGIYSNADSFPSGHTGSAVYIFLSSYFCRAFDKLKKFAVPCFAMSTAYVLMMAISRVMRGAHYLSDVAMGALICMAFILIGVGFMRFLGKRGALESEQ